MVDTLALAITATINGATTALSGDVPSSTVACTLTSPASYTANGVNEFTASDSCKLAASTKYFLVLERQTSANRDLGWNVTASSAVDSSATGWSLITGNRRKTTTSWAVNSSSTLLFEVKGVVVTNVAASGAPSINGILEKDEVLTADTVGIGDPNGLPSGVTYTYRWIRVNAMVLVASTAGQVDLPEVVGLQV